MNPEERAELQRQGAKAAVRGDQAGSNPMDRGSNVPASTGESTKSWSRRRDAWQSGYESQAKTANAPVHNPKGQADDEAA